MHNDHTGSIKGSVVAVNANSLLELSMNNSISPEEFLRCLWKISTGMTRLARKYEGTSNTPMRIYRSRVFECRTLPNDFNEYRYPKNNVKLGRANRESSPVLYASAGGPATFVESRCSEGNIVVVAEYRVYVPMVVQRIGFPDDNAMASDYEELLKKIFTFPGPDYYVYSAQVANHLLGGDVVHGIVYPSIEAQNQSENLAIKTDFVDKNVHLVNATAYEVVSVSEKHQYRVNEVDFGICEEEQVTWMGRKKKWAIKKNGQALKMVANGWNWDAYDEEGNLIDPE